ncbi:GNAT family N-acetyltransferase [Yoonia sp. SS1-5]|uniref:N-acetyltransferase family protein n=1 Tax=Yoonia rhodophyticola TaxID=3137370 RepID=A0AAN0MB69_9RHOB
MIIRPATSADGDAMARIVGDWRPELDGMPVLHTAEEDRWFFGEVIKTQDVLVGASGIGVEGFIARDDQLITQLYLQKSARRKGLGSQLLNKMKARADALALWCFQANLPARNFYEKHGFVAAEKTDGHGNEEHLPDIYYTWKATT